MNDNINFGESLTEILEQRNIKVDIFAKAINVSVTTVYDWKSGKQDIKLSNLIAAANYFNSSISFLIGASENDMFVKARAAAHFGACLRGVMADKHVSTYKLRQHGYGSAHFKNWDNGADPFLSTLLDLSKIFDCTVDCLVGRE